MRVRLLERTDEPEASSASDRYPLLLPEVVVTRWRRRLAVRDRLGSRLTGPLEGGACKVTVAGRVRRGNVPYLSSVDEERDSGGVTLAR